ncbi:hypothetical protein VW29_18165 [Devosia limi DSM 17137]|uniref:DUF1345 domain-containing protein n=1 Tax=Devosia limi DSM 17137 TaxID=1121477 RepID=A0A0F5L597_9HYPH|nr:hypothetical protein VW29_18165 [Devosia limi DSM 17137]
MVVGLASLLVAPGQAVLWGSIAFFAVYMGMSLWFFPRASSAFLDKHADLEDAPAWIIFLATIGLIVMAVVSLFQLVASHDPNSLQLIATGAAVPLGWLTVHAMAAHHYAYVYYAQPRGDARSKTGRDDSAGLQFPSGDRPDGIAFLYFSYVIGMTAQVADVNVTSREMQHLVLMHGIFSFFFNTVIVAATVNVVVSL